MNLLVAVMAAPGATSAGQGAVRIPDAESCPRCEIRLDPVATLAVPEAHSGSGQMLIVADGRSRYWGFSDDRLPLVFAANGRFITAIGRKGSGPGEFINITNAFVTPGDSVVIVDPSNARATVISPELRVARSITFQWRPVYRPVFRRWPDSVIMTAVAGTPDGVGWPLHLISFAGEAAPILKSFGPGTGDVRPSRQPFLRLQPPTRSRGGRAWSVALGSYTLHQWTPALQLGAVLERRPSWFASDVTPGPGHPDEPPPPHMVDVFEDETGLLWVVSRMPSRNWKAAWPSEARRNAAGYDAKGVDILQLWRTVIEIIDPATRAVVRRTFTDEYILGFLANGQMAIYDESPAGEPRYRIVRGKLSRP